MSPLRILHVLNRFTAAGTELAVLRLVRGLDPGIFEQTICSIHSPAPELEQVANTVVLNCAVRERTMLIPAMISAIRKQRPHILHARNWGTIEAVVAAKIAGVASTIYSEHGRNLDTAMSIPRRQRWMRATAFHMATEVFSVSHELKQFYLAQVGPAARKMKVIENGVDTVRFAANSATRSAIRQSLGIGNSEFVIGAVGRLDPIKDCPTLLKAAALLGRRGIPFRLLLIGDGPERAKLEAIIASSSELRPNSRILGQVPDVENWLNGLDVMVLPSLSEGMSNTLLEAMSTSLPTVATAVGAAPEIVENNVTGFLFRPGDVEDLASKLQILSESASQRTDMGARGRNRILQRYSLQRMLTNYHELYLNSLKSTPAGRRALAASVPQLDNKCVAVAGVQR